MAFERNRLMWALISIAGRLVVEFIKVDEKYIQYLDINTPTIIDEVEVTALDANQ